MWDDDTTRIDVANDFYPDKLQLLIAAIDKGLKVAPMVDCIGHTRNNMAQERYKDALIERYGSRLTIKREDGWCVYNYIYKLGE